MKQFLLFLTLIIAVVASSSTSSLLLSNTVGNHMVLQRDRPVTVWGFATAGVVVKTTFAGMTYTTTAGADTIWRQALPAQPATSAPATISFTSSDGGVASLTDVLFGDVHICSGQSNMQFTLNSNAGVPNKTEEIASAAKYPLIRVFTVGQGTSSTTPLTQLKTVEDAWAVSSPASIGGPAWNTFSAVCWFTYRDVFDALGGNVPFGLISNNWGGTPIQHWASPAAIAECKGNADSTLYNSMISPYLVGPMAIRSVIWYQGEANVGGPAAYYACQQPAMVADWRKSFGVDFTFGFVVIAPCDCYNKNFQSADLRQSQLATLRAIPKVAFALATDLVAPFSAVGDIHPVNKQGVGARMAAQILAIEYGQDVDFVVPIFAGQSAVNAATSVSVTVNLNGCDMGCVVQAVTPPSGANNTATFAIQTNDKDATWWVATAKATADGQGLILTAVGTGGSAAVATSYGRADYPLNAAVNSRGMPVAGWCFTLEGVPCYAVVGYETGPVRSPDLTQKQYQALSMGKK